MKKYIVLLFLGATITLNAQVDIELDVPTVYQEQTNWCWAASSKCVLEYYDFKHSQCEIADYVRQNDTLHDLGDTPCCNVLNECNKSAAFNGGPGSGSLQDILVHFGKIPNDVTAKCLTLPKIEEHIREDCPIIIRREKLSNSTSGHAMVIFGIVANVTYCEMIWVMDPEKGKRLLFYDSLQEDFEYKWSHTITLTASPTQLRCNNCIWDEDKGEEGMDCGGPCPPCEHAPQHKSFVTPTNNLPPKSYALEKITAGSAAVHVLSGQNVGFYTMGEIELLPGFEVQEGGSFNAQIKSNILDVTADCNAYCKPHIPNAAHRYCSWTWPHTNNAYIVKVANVLKIYIEVYRSYYNRNWGNLIFSDLVENQEGNVLLWDLIENESPKYLKDGITCLYWISLKIYPCAWGGNGYLYYKVWTTVINDSTPHDEPPGVKSMNQISHTDTDYVMDIDNVMYPEINTTPSFSILPNPNPGTFQLETNFPLSHIGNLKITNLMGATVYETQNVVSNTVQLPRPSAGTFFVVMVLKDGGVLTRKMVVQ